MPAPCNPPGPTLVVAGCFEGMAPLRAPLAAVSSPEGSSRWKGGLGMARYVKHLITCRYTELQPNHLVPQHVSTRLEVG